MPLILLSAAVQFKEEGFDFYSFFSEEMRGFFRFGEIDSVWLVIHLSFDGEFPF